MPSPAPHTRTLFSLCPQGLWVSWYPCLGVSLLLWTHLTSLSMPPTSAPLSEGRGLAWNAASCHLGLSSPRGWPLPCLLWLPQVTSPYLIPNMACLCWVAPRTLLNTPSTVSSPLVRKTKAMGNRQKGSVHHLIHLTTAVGSHKHPVSGSQLQTFNKALAACTGEGGLRSGCCTVTGSLWTTLGLSEAAE